MDKISRHRWFEDDENERVCFACFPRPFTPFTRRETASWAWWRRHIHPSIHAVVLTIYTTRPPWPSYRLDAIEIGLRRQMVNSRECLFPRIEIV
ncbi:hypothetical protein M441DRAFT_267715 [Trichoderma asperellum CBS 433.97]|uniref:Uncharacterized protein n=1 Tax=Trichoderma asperellum (strain ATCC 204424 / CBS 433.97 / NBRC 101777) TaxID=1042311 RepID=A0A2T3YVT9_TRIA4|nr:hypothetical protein M441DRAFT_267715 [Trichoderma asperellum CBS 433.97]PTB36685.1 hypothetical protein M441DRAFT_267715 [Trichoderma asperellum CBS 433.97]